jgi:AcrR family transcriptional regulator
VPADSKPTSDVSDEPKRVGRPRSKERWLKRQREVVDIAAAVFAEQGYHATSIEDIVRATGLQRGGLYHYVDSKADLLIQSHTRFIEPLLIESREIALDDSPADVVLRRLAVALMNDIALYRDQVTVFLHEWRVIRDEPEWAGIRQAREEFEDVIEGVLRRGVDDGMFRISDTKLAMLSFLGMINYSYQWFQPSGRLNGQRIADGFCDIFLEGIRS